MCPRDPTNASVLAAIARPPIQIREHKLQLIGYVIHMFVSIAKTLPMALKTFLSYISFQVFHFIE